MIKRVFALVLIISFFLPSFVSAYSSFEYDNNPAYHAQEDQIKREENQKFAQKVCIERCSMSSNPSCTLPCYGIQSGSPLPTGPAPNANELLIKMSEELKLAQSNADGIDRDLLKINNRNSFEKLQISIFGESPEFRRSLRHNIDEADSHFLNIYRLDVECNCIDRSRPIQNEVESLKSNVNSKYSQAESAARNQGIIDKINKVISNSQK
jgi:hypothetical protein